MNANVELVIRTEGPSETKTKHKHGRRLQQRMFTAARQCVPIMLTPGVLSYETWLNLYGHYVYGMLDFMDRALTYSLNVPMSYIVYIDRDTLYRKFLRFVYHSSLNRFKAYTVIQ